jgi:hypothetical protein
MEDQNKREKKTLNGGQEKTRKGTKFSVNDNIVPHPSGD